MTRPVEMSGLCMASIAAITGIPLVTGERPSWQQVVATGRAVGAGMIVDNVVDYCCRDCPALMECGGPNVCTEIPGVADTLQKNVKEIAALYPGLEARRIETVIGQFHAGMSALEINAIQNPPTNEEEIRRYREDTLWPWAQAMIALKKGSSISGISETVGELTDGVSERDANLIYRLFYASAFHQVHTDQHKYDFHRETGIPAIGSTIEDPEARSNYCHKLADFYAQQSIKHGASPAIFKIARVGLAVVHDVRAYLPPRISTSHFFTA